MTLWTAQREFLKTPIHTCLATASADHVILVGVNMNVLPQPTNRKRVPLA